jgi:hypothetical protein
MHNKYPKGSEWRKWDLHVHTPASILYSEFGDNWDSYVQILFRKAIENKIYAIGITDYYFIEGYKKIKTEYINNQEKLQTLFNQEEIEFINNILLFPNLEFRISKLVIEKERDLKWNRKVNLHLLLSDNIEVEDIEENLLNILTFEDIANTSESIQKTTITKRNIEKFGARLKSEQFEFQAHSDLFVGTLNVAIDENQLINILTSKNSIFKGKYLLGLPADEDLSRVNWATQGHNIRKVLIQKSHFLFSSNQNTVNFGLGKYHDSESDFVNEFGSLKPCLWGSDAHSVDKLFIPDNRRYTWIKANPTFEGLKQVIYEPSERVLIQELIPEEKTPYLVIDKIRFLDTSGKKLFSRKWIEFNQNLNAIIGGKSSGKSLLLFHIAKTLIPEDVNEKTKLLKGSSDYSEFLTKNPFDLEVQWLNGDTDKLSETEKKRETQITFIPQLYINHLAEKDGEKQLQFLINKILKQNEEFSFFLTEKENAIREKKQEIQNLIEELLKLREEVKVIRQEKKSIGDNIKITEEIKRLTEQIEALRISSGFTPEENFIYEKAASKLSILSEKLEKYTSIVSSVENFTTFYNNQYNKLLYELSKEKEKYRESSLEIKLLHILFESIKSKNETVNNNTNNYLQEFNKKIILKFEAIKKSKEETEAELKPFHNKITNQNQLKIYIENREAQQNKLIELNIKEKKLESVISKGRDANNKIISTYTSLFDTYKLINEKLQSENYQKIGDDLELESELYFDCNKFHAFTSLFDNRARLNSFFYNTFDNNNEFVYNKETHIQAIQQIFDKIKEIDKAGIKLKGNTLIRHLYSNLLDDYFDFKYFIKYKGDDILKMSPGKRGLVLLQLVLHLSNATHPILIDQPEDNLDNRTIYDELKQYIREKKKKRQIIIVTHNANLAVSTDAENIIIANQAGQQQGKDKKEFIFEYVSGSLENSFENNEENGILYQYGIREHVCDILEGGKEAFLKREIKYGLNK